MIVFYGSPNSSATRTHWMLEELGIPYDYRQVDLRTPRAERPLDFREASPGCKVPAIVHDGKSFFESMAINLYLAETHGSELGPKDAAERAEILQWSFWIASNVHPLLIVVLYHTALLPEAERRAEEAEQNRGWSADYLQLLDRALVDKQWLVGDRFTVADVNVGSVLRMAANVGVPFGSNISAWHERLAARPAYQKVFGSG